ncbi:MAG: prepilin-type N-terminal cleavage/methylation domain-containing protein [Rickettsiales bacterium]|nr:prepilin-type N-terminal cleavage/methylation domain-containing protein [Rickettsiales bacterium]
MKKTFSKKKSAFSLIELSIVLIVIGLLIAGITGGASLIKSSELRSVMGEARGYAVAVNAFYSQFNALPGDYGTALAPATVAGDADGKIEYFSDAGTPAAEGLQAWLSLKAIGAVDPTVSVVGVGVAQVPGTTGTFHMPASKIKSSGWAFDYNSDAGSLQNVVVLTQAIGTGTAANTLVKGATIATAAITPADGLAIDSKIDDGAANAGKVRAVNPLNGTGCAGGTVTVPSASYTVATTTKACALSYQVDVNS